MQILITKLISQVNIDPAVLAWPILDPPFVLLGLPEMSSNSIAAIYLFAYLFIYFSSLSIPFFLWLMLSSPFPLSPLLLPHRDPLTHTQTHTYLNTRVLQ